MSKLTHSLQWRLLLTLTLVCLLFSGLVASFSFYQSYRQAQALQDTKLTNLVSLAKSHDLSIENDQIDVELDVKLNNTNPPYLAAGENINNLEEDIATHQTLLYWLDDERLQEYFDPTKLNDLASYPDGFYEVQGKTGLWRLYLYTQTQTHPQIHTQYPPLSRTKNHTRPPSVKKNKKSHLVTTMPSATDQPITKVRRLIIGELLDIRNQLAWQSAKKILFPLLLLIPLLLTVIIFTVHQVFKPLAHITELFHQRLDNASPSQLEKTPADNVLLLPPNADKLPSEIIPFIEVIQTQMQRLLDSLAMNDRFVSNASHQLRTPMTAILLQAEQIKLDENATPEQIREQNHAIDTLLDSIKRNNQLINQLLTLSKSEQQNHTLPIAPFSPSQVITEVLLDFYPIASQKNINLGVAILQDDVMLPAGTIAELHFKIIVQNLLDNALKYTPTGGRVDISWFSVDTHAYLQVQDSGMGIEEAELEKILEPFYRAYAVTHDAPATTPSSSIDYSLGQLSNMPHPTQATKHLPEGFGLGLAIVNNLVTASHATLTIANHRNLLPDSTFYRPELAEPIQHPIQPPIQHSDHEPSGHEQTANALLEKSQVEAFIEGLMVQIRW